MNGGKADLTDYGKSLPSLQEIQLQLHALTDNPVDIVVNEDVTVKAESKTNILFDLNIEFNVLEHEGRIDHYMCNDQYNTIVENFPSAEFYFDAYCEDTSDWVLLHCNCKHIHNFKKADINFEIRMEISIPDSNLNKLIVNKNNAGPLQLNAIDDDSFNSDSWKGSVECRISGGTEIFYQDIIAYAAYLEKAKNQNKKVNMKVLVFKDI